MGPFCFTTLDGFQKRVGHGLKHRKGLNSIRMPVPVSIPQPYQSGNMETLKAMLSGQPVKSHSLVYVMLLIYVIASAKLHISESGMQALAEREAW